MTQSEVKLAPVPTAADSFVLIGTFTVPAGVKRLVKLRFCFAPEQILATTSIRLGPVFRMIGSGITEQSPHVYLGMFGGHSCLTDEGAFMDNGVMEYDVDIPVRTGGTIDVQCKSLAEVIAAGTMSANLYYDEIDSQSTNQMADEVDAVGTLSAGAFATVGTLTVPKLKEGNDPKRIKAVVMGVALDNGTPAHNLRLSPHFRMTGSGIGEGGTHEFMGACAGAGIVVIGGYYASWTTVKVMVNIPVQPGGTILVEHQFDISVPTASSVAFGVLYE